MNKKYKTNKDEEILYCIEATGSMGYEIDAAKKICFNDF